MNTYSFTLVLKGVNETTPDLEDALYNSHCDDALINFRNGTVYLDFDRESETLENAIISAIKDVESSSLSTQVIHVAPDEWVNEAEIAKRLEQSRQTVSLWVKGARRSELPFPSPTMKLSEKSPLWRWSDITIWLYENKIITDMKVIHEAKLIECINAALEERNEDDKKKRHDLLRKLAA